MILNVYKKNSDVNNANSVIEVMRRSTNDKSCVILNALVFRSSLVL